MTTLLWKVFSRLLDYTEPTGPVTVQANLELQQASSAIAPQNISVSSQTFTVTPAPPVVSTATGVSGPSALPGWTASSIEPSVTVTLAGLHSLDIPGTNAPNQLPPSSSAQKCVDFDAKQSPVIVSDTTDQLNAGMRLRPGLINQPLRRDQQGSNDLKTRNGKSVPMGNPPLSIVHGFTSETGHSVELRNQHTMAGPGNALLRAELTRVQNLLLKDGAKVPGSKSVGAAAHQIATAGGMSSVSSVPERLLESSSLPTNDQFNSDTIDNSGFSKRVMPADRIQRMVDTNCVVLNTKPLTNTTVQIPDFPWDTQRVESDTDITPVENRTHYQTSPLLSADQFSAGLLAPQQQQGEYQIPNIGVPPATSHIKYDYGRAPIGTYGADLDQPQSYAVCTALPQSYGARAVPPSASGASTAPPQSYGAGAAPPSEGGAGPVPPQSYGASTAQSQSQAGYPIFPPQPPPSGSGSGAPMAPPGTTVEPPASLVRSAVDPYYQGIRPVVDLSAAAKELRAAAVAFARIPRIADLERAPSGTAAMKCESYKSDMDIDQWFEKFEVWLVMNRIVQDYDKVSRLYYHMALHNSAFIFALPPEIKGCYNTLRQAILDRFRDKRSVADRYSDLVEMKQGDNTVDFLYEHFINAVLKLFPDRDIRTDKLLMTRFESSLRPEIYTKYLERTSSIPVATLEQAKKVAIECETLLNSERYMQGIFVQNRLAAGLPADPPALVPTTAVTKSQACVNIGRIVSSMFPPSPYTSAPTQTTTRYQPINRSAAGNSDLKPLYNQLVPSKTQLTAGGVPKPTHKGKKIKMDDFDLWLKDNKPIRGKERDVKAYYQSLDKYNKLNGIEPSPKPRINFIVVQGNHVPPEFDSCPTEYFSQARSSQDIESSVENNPFEPDPGEYPVELVDGQPVPPNVLGVGRVPGSKPSTPLPKVSIITQSFLPSVTSTETENLSRAEPFDSYYHDTELDTPISCLNTVPLVPADSANINFAENDNVKPDSGQQPKVLIQNDKLALRAKLEQEEDENLKAMINYKSTNKFPTDPNLASYVKNTRNYFLVFNGVLYYDHHYEKKFKEHKGVQRLLVAVPNHLIPQILEENHCLATSGHFGASKVWHRLKRLFWWENMPSHIKQYVASCRECALRQGQGAPHLAPLKSILPPEKPGQLAAADLITLPLTNRNNRYALLVIDHCSKYMSALPLEDKSSTTVAHAFENIFTATGGAKTLLTDKHTVFTGSVFQKMLKKHQVNHVTTTPYHPKCNGLAERAVGTLADMLSKVVNQKSPQWDEHVFGVTWAYNRTPHSSMKLSPYYLQFGRMPAAAGQTAVGRLTPCLFETSEDFLTDSAVQQFYLQRACRAQLESKARQDRCYNNVHSTKDGRFVVGNRVLLFSPNVQSHKLSALYTGPYMITHIRDTNAYIVLVSNCEKAPEEVHFDRLSLCYPELDDFPSTRTFRHKSGEGVTNSDKQERTRHPTATGTGEKVVENFENLQLDLSGSDVEPLEETTVDPRTQRRMKRQERKESGEHSGTHSINVIRTQAAQSVGPLGPSSSIVLSNVELVEGVPPLPPVEIGLGGPTPAVGTCLSTQNNSLGSVGLGESINLNKTVDRTSSTESIECLGIYPTVTTAAPVIEPVIAAPTNISSSFAFNAVRTVACDSTVQCEPVAIDTVTVETQQTSTIVTELVTPPCEAEMAADGTPVFQFVAPRRLLVATNSFGNEPVIPPTEYMETGARTPILEVNMPTDALERSHSQILSRAVRAAMSSGVVLAEQNSLGNLADAVSAAPDAIMATPATAEVDSCPATSRTVNPTQSTQTCPARVAKLNFVLPTPVTDVFGNSTVPIGIVNPVFQADSDPTEPMDTSGPLSVHNNEPDEMGDNEPIIGSVSDPRNVGGLWSILNDMETNEGSRIELHSSTSSDNDSDGEPMSYERMMTESGGKQPTAAELMAMLSRPTMVISIGGASDSPPPGPSGDYFPDGSMVVEGASSPKPIGSSPSVMTNFEQSSSDSTVLSPIQEPTAHIPSTVPLNTVTSGALTIGQVNAILPSSADTQTRSEVHNEMPIALDVNDKQLVNEVQGMLANVTVQTPSTGRPIRGHTQPKANLWGKIVTMPGPQTGSTTTTGAGASDELLVVSSGSKTGKVTPPSPALPYKYPELGQVPLFRYRLVPKSTPATFIPVPEAPDGWKLSAALARYYIPAIVPNEVGDDKCLTTHYWDGDCVAPPGAWMLHRMEDNENIVIIVYNFTIQSPDDRFYYYNVFMGDQAPMTFPGAGAGISEPRERLPDDLQDLIPFSPPDPFFISNYWDERQEARRRNWPPAIWPRVAGTEPSIGLCCPPIPVNWRSDMKCVCLGDMSIISNEMPWVARFDQSTPHDSPPNWEETLRVSDMANSNADYESKIPVNYSVLMRPKLQRVLELGQPMDIIIVENKHSLVSSDSLNLLPFPYETTVENAPPDAVYLNTEYAPPTDPNLYAPWNTNASRQGWSDWCWPHIFTVGRPDEFEQFILHLQQFEAPTGWVNHFGPTPGFSIVPEENPYYFRGVGGEICLKEFDTFSPLTGFHAHVNHDSMNYRVVPNPYPNSYCIYSDHHDNCPHDSDGIDSDEEIGSPDQFSGDAPTKRSVPDVPPISGAAGTSSTQMTLSSYTEVASEEQDMSTYKNMSNEFGEEITNDFYSNGVEETILSSPTENWDKSGVSRSSEPEESIVPFAPKYHYQILIRMLYPDSQVGIPTFDVPRLTRRQQKIDAMHTAYWTDEDSSGDECMSGNTVISLPTVESCIVGCKERKTPFSKSVFTGALHYEPIGVFSQKSTPTPPDDPQGLDSYHPYPTISNVIQNKSKTNISTAARRNVNDWHPLYRMSMPRYWDDGDTDFGEFLIIPIIYRWDDPLKRSMQTYDGPLFPLPDRNWVWAVNATGYFRVVHRDYVITHPHPSVMCML